MDIEKQILNDEDRKKIEALQNKHVEKIIEKYVKLCKPSKVTVLTDSKEDLKKISEISISHGEEKPLNTKGHTIHFDGIDDQGRDLVNTRVLLPEGKRLSKAIETLDREEGLNEIFGLLDGVMEGKEMYIKFYCLGPQNSKFSIAALQMTDSSYVIHSEDLLYRQGYEEFKRLKGQSKFFHFIHSAGELDSRKNSRNIDKRRVYMDLEEERVFTINNQYAGNSVGLKKLALRLAISKAGKEDWLCEHMFVMGAKAHKKDRVTYFTGAYPSGCGKTSTAMIPGQTIIGDDIAYIKPGDDGQAYAVNVEQGIFGIIEDVNPIDDPLIYKTITTPRELIFSNILIKDNEPYWLGMGKPLPESGENFSGSWLKGKTDKAGKSILAAHKNARYTLRIKELENADNNLENPNGVPVRGFIYGGRDSDTSVPVFQSLSWAHGVFMGAAQESETTATAIGATGARKHNPMSNIEFLTVPLGTYIQNHMRFGESLDIPPLVFSTNYFIKKDGNFLTDKVDKKVWLMWMEGRVHNEYTAIETPIGYIPKYEDIKNLFDDIFKKGFSKEMYNELFKIRITRFLEKFERIEKIFRAEEDIPEIFYVHLNEQRKRLLDAKEKYGDEALPEAFE